MHGNDLDRPDRVRTGIPGLDEILLGGITRDNCVLVEGAPGVGKTTLGLGMLHAGAARFDEPGVVVSFELDTARLIRDAAGFGWDLPALVDQRRLRLVNATPAVLLKDLRAEDSVLFGHLEELGARRLLLDGLTPLRLYAEALQLPFRADLHALLEALSRRGVTTVMTAERDGGAPDLAHERYLFDTVISLRRGQRRRRVSRSLTIEKSRGQGYVSGSHTMDIAAGRGVTVYRRAQARPLREEPQPTSLTRLSTGIAALDAMMDGGLYEGSITLVTGISGTGKTVAGVQFLCHAAAAGRRALLVTLDEHPAQLMRNAATMDLDLRGHQQAGTVLIDYESPLELDLDVHFDRVRRLILEQRVACVVFDSVAVYTAQGAEEAADFLYALASFCKAHLVTAYLHYESPELLGVSQISEELKGSHLVDNIVLLSYVEISTRLRRALAVPKVRGSHNLQVTREYVIGAGGISLVAEPPDSGAEAAVPQLPFSSYYGLLSRSPSRKSPAIEEAIARGEPLPGDGPAGGPRA